MSCVEEPILPAVKVCAQVCLRCKERLYSQKRIVRKFEQIKAKLERQENEEFRSI